jgi:hypothetical protein
MSAHRPREQDQLEEDLELCREQLRQCQLELLSSREENNQLQDQLHADKAEVRLAPSVAGK